MKWLTEQFGISCWPLQLNWEYRGHVVHLNFFTPLCSEAWRVLPASQCFQNVMTVWPKKEEEGKKKEKVDFTWTVALCREVGASALLIYVFSSSRGKSWRYVHPLRLLGAAPASIYLHGKAASSSGLAVIKRQTCCWSRGHRRVHLLDCHSNCGVWFLMLLIDTWNRRHCTVPGWRCKVLLSTL